MEVFREEVCITSAGALVLPESTAKGGKDHACCGTWKTSSTVSPAGLGGENRSDPEPGAVGTK